MVTIRSSLVLPRNVCILNSPSVEASCLPSVHTLLWALSRPRCIILDNRLDVVVISEPRSTPNVLVGCRCVVQTTCLLSRLKCGGVVKLANGSEVGLRFRWLSRMAPLLRPRLTLPTTLTSLRRFRTLA